MSKCFIHNCCKHPIRLYLVDWQFHWKKYFICKTTVLSMEQGLNLTVALFCKIWCCSDCDRDFELDCAKCAYVCCDCVKFVVPSAIVSTLLVTIVMMVKLFNCRETWVVHGSTMHWWCDDESRRLWLWDETRACDCECGLWTGLFWCQLWLWWDSSCPRRDGGVTSRRAC